MITYEVKCSECGFHYSSVDKAESEAEYREHAWRNPSHNTVFAQHTVSVIYSQAAEYYGW